MLIGICGRIGDGKTTLARILVQKYGFSEISFADPIKRIGTDIFGFPDSSVYGTQQEKLAKNEFWKISGREFMCTLGEGIQKLIPELEGCWIRILKRYVTENPGKYVISDVRKLKEAEMIRELNGIIVRVKRDCDRSGTEHSHVSESEVDFIKADFEGEEELFKFLA